MFSGSIEKQRRAVIVKACRQFFFIISREL